MSKKTSVELDSYSEETSTEIPFRTKQCKILAYNRYTKTVGFKIGDVKVQTVLETNLPPDAKYITVKYRKTESGEYEFIF